MEPQPDWCLVVITTEPFQTQKFKNISDPMNSKFTASDVYQMAGMCGAYSNEYTLY